MDELYLVAGAIALAALVYAAIVYQRDYDRRYVEDLQSFVLSLGGQLSRVDNGAVIQKLSEFPEFLEGRGQQVINTFARPIRSGTCFHFDHSYRIMRQKISQTAAIFDPSPPMDIPAFTLRCQCTPFSGLQFSDRSTFSSLYSLTGDDNAKLLVFQAPLVELFEKSAGLCVESNGRQILLYREGHRVEAKDFPTWLELCDQVIGHLSQVK